IASDQSAVAVSDTVLDAAIVSQGTALGSIKLPMAGGSVTTAAPTYSTGQINPLSLDTTGALRVNVTAGGAGGGIVTNAGTFAVQDTALEKFGTCYYVVVPASQTAAVLQSSTGATGDYLNEVTVIPATTTPGVVTIMDNATSIIAYPGGGTTPLLTLTP